MREKILTFIEKNSRVDLADLAVMLGVEEAAVANEIADMEKEGIICGYHTLINWDKTSEEKLTALVEVKVTPQRGFGSDKLSPLDSVLSTATHFILKKYKDHGSIMAHEKKDERMLVTP